MTRFHSALAAASFAALGASATAALAHPHVWVTYETHILYDKGTVTGVDHIWTFDDMYTAMAVEGLDKNKDGIYDREELAELAKVNLEGLKDFDYFTFAKLGEAPLKFVPPTESWLEHKDGILRLHFHMNLETPVLADAQGLTFQIYDPSFYIAFEPVAKNAVQLSGAPDGCTAVFVDPQNDKNQEDVKKLGDAFGQQLGGDVSGAIGSSKSIAVNCTKS